MNDAPMNDAPGAHSDAPMDTPTGHQIRTDRPCAGCGFNLFGQPIVREGHYGLVSARCPECGRLAALQEYPALGKWADRWAKLLAATWIVALVFALFAQCMPTLGIMMASMQQVYENAGTEIAQRYQATLQDDGATTTGVPLTGMPFYTGAWTDIDADWWAGDRAAYLALTDRTHPFNRETATFWFVLSLITFAGGAFWSTVTLGSRRVGGLVLGMIPVVIAAAFVWIVQTPAPFGRGGTLIARDAAAELFRTPMLIGSACVLLPSLVVGVFVGRKLSRLIVRLCLPPRMRSALSILWTRDGLAVPGGGSRGR